MISVQSWVMIGMAGALLAAGLGLKAQTSRLTEAKLEKEMVQMRYDAFVQVAKETGERLARETKEKDDANRARQEAANTEIQKARRDRDGIYDAYRKLRDQRGTASANSGTLPFTPTFTPSAERTCFDSAKFVAAMGILEVGVPRITEQGDGAVGDLNCAKQWASEGEVKCH